MKTLFSLILVLSGINVSGQTKSTFYWYFDTDKAVLDALHEDVKSLDAIIKKNPDLVLYITGHTDSVGSEESNQDLSERRAQYVAARIRERHPNQKIMAVGFGETRPLNKNSTAAEMRLNRRVHLAIAHGEPIPDKFVSKPNKAIKNRVDNPISTDSVFATAALKPVRGVGITAKRGSLPEPPTRREGILPEDAQPPTEGCRVFFSGLMVAHIAELPWYSKIFTEDPYSEYVGYGSYHNLREALPNSVEHTFDGIAIGDGTHLTIYERPNFEGKIVLDVVGPIVINNTRFMGSRPSANKMRYNSELQALYPPSKRKWSRTDMHRWSYGSLKIRCADDESED